MNSVEFVEKLKVFQSKLNIHDHYREYEYIRDFIFYEIDNAHCNGEFNEVDQIFSLIDINKYHWYILYAIIAITYHAKDKLKKRDSFYKSVEKYIIDNNFLKENHDFLLKWK